MKENPEQWQECKARENERIHLSQLKKKNQVTSKQNADSPRSSLADLNYRPYKTPQALGEAVSGVMLPLPLSSLNKQPIVLTLANEVGCSTSQNPKGIHQKDKGLSKETKAAILDFYEKSDVT